MTRAPHWREPPARRDFSLDRSEHNCRSAVCARPPDIQTPLQAPPRLSSLLPTLFQTPSRLSSLPLDTPPDSPPTLPLTSPQPPPTRPRRARPPSPRYDEYRSFSDAVWNEFSVRLPSRLAADHPGSVRQLGYGAFYWPPWNTWGIAQLYRSGRCLLPEAFAVHLWETKARPPTPRPAPLSAVAPFHAHSPRPLRPVTRSPLPSARSRPAGPLTLAPAHLLTLAPAHPLTRSPSHPLTLAPAHPLTLAPAHLPRAARRCGRVCSPRSRPRDSRRTPRASAALRSRCCGAPSTSLPRSCARESSPMPRSRCRSRARCLTCSCPPAPQSPRQSQRTRAEHSEAATVAARGRRERRGRRQGRLRAASTRRAPSRAERGLG